MSLSRLSVILILFLGFISCSEVESLELKKVDGFAVNNLTAQGASLELDLSVYNPNGFKIKVLDYDLDVFINNVRIGKAKLDKRLVMPRKSTTTQHVKVDVKFKNMLFGALPILGSLKKGKQAKVRLSGNVKGGAFLYRKTMQIDFEKDISLTR